MEWCKGCPGYSVDTHGNCTFCGLPRKTSEPQPPSWWRTNDLKSVSNSINNYNKHEDDSSDAVIVTFCYRCGNKSLFYNTYKKYYECFNLDCHAYGISPNELKRLSDFFKEAPTVEETPPEFTNPMLLSVKMFLADARSWRRSYKEGEYVCSDFTQEVVDAATERGMRCGYAVLRFKDSPIGHAITAFDTDYGLIFIEPQSGEQLEISINKPYPIDFEGVIQNTTIISICITWNDGTSTQIDE